MKTVHLNKASISLMIVVLALAVASLACSTSGSPTARPASIPPSQTARSASADCLEGVYPGVTTREQVVGSFGEPASAETNESQEMLLYAAREPGQFHTIVLQNNVVGLISVILDEKNPLAWSSVKKQYGSPAITTFSHYLEGTRAFIYPERGQSFVALPDLDTVLARECFAPMTADEFMSSWGKSLPQENPFNR